MIKKLFYTLLLLLTPSLVLASQATLVSWDTPTTCIITCATYTAPDCPVSEPTVTTIGCNDLTGYRLYAGTSSGVYTISTDVAVVNSASLATVTGALSRGQICVVATALTANAESDYSNEKCYWNLGNAIFSDNATRPVPKKPGSAGSGTYVSDNFNRADANPIGGNWTTVPDAGDLRISGNQLMGVGSSNTIYWNANTFSKNHCSQIAMVDIGATYGGPAVDVSPSQHSYYYFKVANGGAAYEYGKVVYGVWAPLGATVPGSPQVNDMLTLCRSGTSLTGYVNGLSKETRTDSDLDSGGPGVSIYGTVTHLDNWSGWDGSMLPVAPNQYVQAEAGTLSSMATGVSGADTYIYGTTSNTGYARFAFAITTPGLYKLQARVNSNNDGGQNSFFIGHNNESVQGNDAYTYDLPLVGSLTWDDVNERGSGATPFDPMVWNLAVGIHSFTFYVRESNSWLDQIRLVPISVPDQYIQAEAGTLSGLATGVSGTDTYIYTTTDNTGSAAFVFNVTVSGNYKLQARANSHDSDGQNSFFVGIDGEPAQGDDTYTYDLSLFNVFTWEDVSKRGNGTPNHIEDQYQPMIWPLSAGQHTFTFYGRETNTWLDQIRLVFVP